MSSPKQLYLGAQMEKKEPTTTNNKVRQHSYYSVEGKMCNVQTNSISLPGEWDLNLASPALLSHDLARLGDRDLDRDLKVL